MLRSSLVPAAAAATLIAALLTPVTAADWPQWRGPDRNDHSPDTDLMESWPDGGPERAWLFRDAGKGYGGPAIVDGRLYTLGIRNEVEEVVLCLDAATGEEIWATTIGSLFRNNWGDGPRSTPTFDDGRLYCLGAKGDLVCLDADSGNEVWSKNLVDDFGGDVPGWGYCESPLVVDDKVIATPGGNEGAIVALDKKSGDKRWQSKDFTDGAQYSSCILVEHGGKRQVVQLVMNNVVGVDLANGDVLWTSPWDGRTAVIPTPIFHDGHVYVTSGYGVGCKLIKLPASGKGDPTEIYKNEVMINHHGGVVLVDDHLYGYSDGNGWVCQEFMTGKQVWASKDLGKGAVHYADGMLYCLDEGSGTVVLAEASPDGWKEHGRFQLDPQSDIRSDRGRIWTHPVVLDGLLYLRDQDLVYAYKVGK